MIPDEPETLVERPAAGRIFESQRRVRLADSSPGGRLRLDACARFLQDIANDDSRDAGSSNPTAWVARRTVIHVDRFPRYLDMTSLCTWCSGLGPRWAERRYSVVADGAGDATGALGSIQAATLWVHIDMETMKPIPVPADFAAQFGTAAGGRVVKARLHLPSRPPDGAGVSGQWPLRYVDVDVLGHVNNSVYWAMVEEQLATRPDLRAPMRVTLEHHDAIDPDDDVTVTRIDDPSDCRLTLWITTATGRLAAVVSVRTVG